MLYTRFVWPGILGCVWCGRCVLESHTRHHTTPHLKVSSINFDFPRATEDSRMVNSPGPAVYLLPQSVGGGGEGGGYFRFLATITVLW